mmetsp:Transcript_8115/g.8309  ORF Transcript_8115/g.8309 Transcript_8115/m.8309 type:complete len:163 (-) Transcript_8115:431-919(-)
MIISPISCIPESISLLGILPPFTLPIIFAVAPHGIGLITILPDFRILPHFDIPEHRRVDTDQHVVPDFGMTISEGIAGSTKCDPVEECAPASDAGTFSDGDSVAEIKHYGRADGGERVDIDSEGGGGLGLEPHAHETGGGSAIAIGIGKGLLPLHPRRTVEH